MKASGAGAVDTAAGERVFERVAVGYDGAAGGADALALGWLLADAAGAPLTIVAVGGGDDLASAAARAAASVPGAETRIVAARSAARGLHDVAAEIEADVLALGSSHRAGVGKVLAGSVTERVLHGAPCAIAVAPNGYAALEPGEPRVIAVGFDGLAESRAALVRATRLAEACGATLRVIAVDDPHNAVALGVAPGYGATGAVATSSREYLERALHDALAGLPRSVRAAGTVVAGAAVDQLAAEADKGADLLFVGSRNYGPVRRVLLGGVSSKLVRCAPCPVLVVPRAGGDQRHGERAVAAAAVHA
jgi:nucleotide-binding universal stress UspA family protein